MKLKLTFLFLLSLLLFSCGSDDEEELLLGKYTITSLVTTNCDDPDLNISLQGSSEGLCEEEDGEEVCLNICFTFTETNFSFDFGFSVDGVSVGSFSGDSAYDPATEDFTFCPPDSDCSNIAVSNDKDEITISGTDEDNCQFTMVLRRS